MSDNMSGLLSWHCHGVCPHDSCLISVLRGFRNGAIYGAKIRAPHALVMTFLFGRGSLKDQLLSIFRATYAHSINLGRFVALYKFLVCVMRHMRQKESGLNALVAGFVGGWVVWGGFSPVNSQINMYILSRITWGLVHTALKHKVVEEVPYGYEIYAATCWAIVMYLFHYQRGTLQNSLEASMQYLYSDSDKWPVTTSGSIDPVDWLMSSV